jgi:hypothetical protein
VFQAVNKELTRSGASQGNDTLNRWVQCPSRLGTEAFNMLGKLSNQNILRKRRVRALTLVEQGTTPGAANDRQEAKVNSCT